MDLRISMGRSARRSRLVPHCISAPSWFGITVICCMLAVGCTAEQSIETSGVSEATETVPIVLTPIAVVDDTDAFLGILDPTEKAKKDFTIRNAGEAPLILKRGGTSCKCTMSTLPKEPIQPGQAAVVRVSTKSEEAEGKFDHTATILTNDPKHKRIKFRVSGSFQKVVAFDPPRLVLTNLNREKPTTVEAVVYSQYFRDFDLAAIESSMEDLAWELKPVEERTLKGLNARCGHRLRLTFPPTAKTGEFWDTLRVTARSDDDPPVVREVTWQIAGSSRPRAQMSGENFAIDKVLRMGTFRRWEGAKERLTLTVYDDHRNLKVEAIETTPEFLKVEVVPINPDKPDSGLYWVHVEIPKDAPACSHTGDRRGTIRIISDHPAIPVMSFSVQFAVTSS